VPVSAIWQAVVKSVERLGTARPGFIVAALVLYIVSVFIVGARWRRFVRLLGGDTGLLRATLAHLGGIAAGNLTPSSRLGGEACRIALVQTAGRVTWGQAALAAAWDRLSEVPPLVVLAVMALIAARDLAAHARSVALVVAAVAALIVIAVGVRMLQRSRLTLHGWRQRLALDRIKPWDFAVGVGYSSLLWLQDVVRLTCVAAAFGVALSPTRIAMVSIAAALGGLVPTMGGLGAVEGGLVAALRACGVDLPTAAAITAAERAISYGFSTVSGAIVVALLGGRSLWDSVRRSPAPGEQPLDNRDSIPPAG
jgi:uncharacterized membrane protein YbhN (UPF0104 family)